MDNAPQVAPELFEAVVTAFAETLVRHYRERCCEIERKQLTSPVASVASATESPWLTVAEAGERAQCGRKTFHAEVQAKRLRAAHIGAGRSLRIHIEWVDDWLRRMAVVP